MDMYILGAYDIGEFSKSNIQYLAWEVKQMEVSMYGIEDISSGLVCRPDIDIIITM
jgi:hypothetical protein